MPCRLVVDTYVLEKHTVSIFRAEVANLGSGRIYIRPEEGKAEDHCFSLPFLWPYINPTTSQLHHFSPEDGAS
jgi:hypothetical protein